MLANDKMDPVLEIWVDEDGAPPALVRLVGVLDLSTSDSLLLVIRQLFDEGSRQVTIDMTRAEVALESRGHNAYRPRAVAIRYVAIRLNQTTSGMKLLVEQHAGDKDESRPSM